MHRTLVSCGLVSPDTMKVAASDGTVWLHHVERDEQGKPIPGQIDRWLNLLWAPPRVDAVWNDTMAPSRNCSQSRKTRVDSTSGRTDKYACPR
jgi:hypothetical protein